MRVIISVFRAADETVDCRTHHTADDRRQPKQPELGNRPTAIEDGDTRAAGRIHGGIGYRNADQVNQGETETDGNRSEPLGRTLVSCTENDDQINLEQAIQIMTEADEVKIEL